MIHLSIYLLDHHSTSVLILAAVVTVFALGGIAAVVVVVKLTSEQISSLRAGAARWRDLYLLIALVILCAFSLNMRPEWVYVHIAAILCASLILGYDLLFADSPPLSRRWILASVFAAVVLILVRINALSVYPAPIIIDEPEVLSWAMSYVQHGSFSDPIMYYGSLDIQRFMLPVAWWISVFGPGFWQTRLFFFLLIFPLIGLTGLAAHNLYGNGWITALVLFSSAIVMEAARIRHDIGLALAVAASIWLYTEALKRDKAALHFLAGLAIGLGWFAHYHAIGFGVALTLAFYLPHYVERWRQGRRLPETGAWLFVLGGLSGAAVVFVVQVLPDWTGFLAVRQPRNPQTLQQFAESFLGHWGTIGEQSQFEFLLLMAAIAAAIWRHKRNDVTLVLLVLLLHLALALQASLLHMSYVIPITPVYGILIAALFTEGFQSRVKRSLAWVAASLVMSVNLGLTVQTPLAYLRAGGPLELPIPPVVTWIKENVDPANTIVTEHWYYVFLTDYRFISPLSPDYAPLSKRLATKEAMWDEIAPDVVVIDRNLSTCCVPPILTETYLQSRGYREVAEIPGENYPVYIYEKGGGDH